MGRLEEKQWMEGAHAMRVRISPSWTAGRTCSEPTPIVPTRVKAPSSPSLLGLFAVRRLVSRWLQGKTASPTASTPNPQLRKAYEGRERNYRSRHAPLRLSPGRERGHSMAEPVTSLGLGDSKGGAERHKGLWGQETAPGSHFRSWLMFNFQVGEP